MLHKIFRLVFTLCGMLFGYGVSNAVIEDAVPWLRLEISALGRGILSAVFILLFGIIIFKLYPTLSKSADKAAKSLDRSISRVPVNDLVAGGIGLIFGLIIAFFLTQIIYEIEILQTAYLSTIISVIMYFIFGVVGVMAGRRVSREAVRLAPVLSRQFAQVSQRSSKDGEEGPGIYGRGRSRNKCPSPKVLDTSVIIDGRIIDVLKTGFVEGEIVIPDFVLVELRHIADSADALKRNRGRRGLDILNRIQEGYGIEIYNTASDKSLESVPEVDVKLLKLAQNIKGMVMTNDFNLNKVAAIEGVPVLNINDLANALKPVVLPGENITVCLVKEGKEMGQGVAYLDDGTMIVVENGRSYIGKTIEVSVTSVLQTSAGRMIFARPGV